MFTQKVLPRTRGWMFDATSPNLVKKSIFGLFLVLSIYLSLILYSTLTTIFFTLLMVGSTVYRNSYACYIKKIRSNESSERCIEIQMISPPKWWIPALGYPVVYPLFAFLFVVLLSRETEVSISGFLSGLDTGMTLVKGIFSPKWELLPDAIFIYAKQTVEIALLGTMLGTLLALPISLCCAKNVMRGSFIAQVIYYFCRSIVALIRATPVFLIGLIFVAIVGLGPFPGVLAIAMFSLGINVKLFSEAIEGIDNGHIDAIYAVGANRWQVIMYAVIPQFIKPFIASTLYCMEINIHSATVLGLIGAQGIGLPIHEYVSTFAYREASVYIILVIVMTMVTDFGSGFLRSKMK